MKKLVLILLVLFFILLGYGVFVSQYDLNIKPSIVSHRTNDFLYEYKGVININTRYSTGSGSIDEIIKAAQAEKLDFIIITDRTLTDDIVSTWEGYHNNLLVIFAAKSRYLDSIILRLNKDQDNIDLKNPFIHITDLLTEMSPKNKDFIVLTHPFNKGNEWSGDLPPGLQGIEIINLKSIWQNTWLKSKISLLWTPLLYPFNPDLALVRLFGDLDKEIEFWDKENQVRKLIGYAGADADSRFRLFQGRSINLPPYSRLFKMTTNHLVMKSELTGQFQSDKDKIYEALFRGQHFMSLDIIGSSDGFHFYAQNKNKIHLTGSELTFNQGIKLKYELPFQPTVDYKVRVKRNGITLVEYKSQKSEYLPKQKGTYRLEVLVKPQIPLPKDKLWIPWIITNPIYLN